ncbi:glycine-rich domain-containing protein 1 isoform X2 [Euphorbia lathyris]|uniref:glycine-rich domain-containing protein 1 isoform X2 n=1 Tax=Euphorbia lathyris TaxID=212925 RepID=UPI0033142FD6
MSAARTLSEISEVESTVRLSLDLVSAAKRNIGFLRAVSESQWLHEKATVVEAIRRYDELWMPLISDLTVGLTPPMVLPPFDIEWIWFCHTLNPISYRNYCETRFSKLIGKPMIFNEENEEYALVRCQDQWRQRYPTESFENETDSDSSLQPDTVVKNEHLFNLVQKQRFVCNKFQWPYMSELVYLIAARQRYKGFLYLLLQRFSDGVSSRLVPTLDILLMWITHQSYPTVYAEDMKEMEADIMGKIAEIWDTVKEKEVEDTKKVWERTFDQPYEKAGGAIDFHGVPRVKSPAHWLVSDSDVNTKYKSLLPRFLLEACVSAKFSKVKDIDDDLKFKVLRLRVVRCHRQLKIDKHISDFSMDSWKKHSQLYCEFGTKGLILELRRLGGGCFKASKLENTASFLWNELLRAHSLTLERQINKQLRIVASITPPVQAPYLLKCVPDRVTDDSGAMVSDVILKMNNYRPQEGRWLSRTVLDHAGRECFVVRIRMGGGFWRRGGETPSAVKWEERIIEVRQGSWSYVAGSIGRAPVQRK